MPDPDSIANVYGPLQTIEGLAFREVGAGSPLVLLHGGVGSRTHWQRNVPRLRQAFTVITIDLPGFGESCEAPAAIEDYLQCVGSSLASRLRGTAFGMAAFSFGAAVGCAALKQAGLKPDRLALIAPAGFGVDKKRDLGLERLPRAENGLSDALRVVVARNLGRSMLAAPPASADEVVDIHLHNLARTRYDSRLLSMRESLIDDLCGLTMPMLWLWGRDDVFPWPSVENRIEMVRRSFPDSRTLAVSGSGHWVQYEQHNAFDDALIAFLQE